MNYFTASIIIKCQQVEPKITLSAKIEFIEIFL